MDETKNGGTRHLFLKGIGFIYFCAFASIYVQFPGTLGVNGLLPAEPLVENNKERLGPSLFMLIDHQTLGLTFDGFFELICLICMGFSAAIAFGLGPLISSPTFALLFFGYLSVYKAGSTFMSFQWDILLLELGFACILYAPRFPSLHPEQKEPHPMATWVLRAILFKLLFMSGVVKLQSQCPTWTGLTALKYHYATQCIPTPLAWYAHQLPDFIQKFSVAATIFFQLVCSFLLLSGLRSLRVLAVIPQIMLQVLILLTGNYNFFNLCTILLCIPVLDDRVLGALRLIRSSQAKSSTKGKKMKSKSGDESSESAWLSFALEAVSVPVVCAGLVAIFFKMFTVSGYESFDLSQMDITMDFSVPDMNVMIQKYLGQFIAGLCILYGLIGAHHLFVVGQEKERRNLPAHRTSAQLLHSVTTSALGFLLFCSVISHLNQLGNFQMPSVVRANADFFEPLRVSSGYGLFRRMTGVGPSAFDENGVEIPVVQRPEVVISGSFDQQTWVEYEFKYKPGSVDRRPPVVAPHQPRLDWQMWFAALGSYQNAPWIVHLVYKLQNNVPEVVDLLGGVPEEFSENPPEYIRADLYHYDFDVTGGEDGSAWWKRQKVSEYLPSLERGNDSVVKFVQSQGWPLERVEKTADGVLQFVVDMLRPMGTLISFTTGVCIVCRFLQTLIML